MKKIRMISAVLLSVVLMVTSLSMTSFAAYTAKAGKAGWTDKSQWYLWSQGASSSSTVRNVGCRTVAYAKMIAEAGYANFNNPDEFSDYLVKNGLVNSKYQETTAGKAPDMYTDGVIKFCGKESLTYSKNGKKYYYSKKTANKKIMNLLEEGYYLCLMGPSHTTYVLRGASLEAGKALISDSWQSWAYSSYANKIAYTNYNYAKFSNIWKFKVEPKTTNENNSDEQEVYVENGIYRIGTGNINYYVDVAGNGTENSTNIQINSYLDSGSQAFYIFRESNGWYKIKHIYSGRNLAIDGEMAASGVNVMLWDEYDSDAQRWKFFKNGDYLYIKSALGYYLDVDDGNFNIGSNIQTWTKNDTLAQKFSLVKETGYGVISDSVDYDLAIHSSMDYNYSSQIGTVVKGEIVRVCGRNGKFAYVKHRNVVEGWCSGKYVIDI